MKPDGDPLYRQHCKPQVQFVRISCRDRDLCLALKKRLAPSTMKAAESEASTDGNSTQSTSNKTSGGGSLGTAVGTSAARTTGAVVGGVASHTNDVVGGALAG
jgi:hypothetical protein